MCLHFLGVKGFTFFLVSPSPVLPLLTSAHPLKPSRWSRREPPSCAITAAVPTEMPGCRTSSLRVLPCPAQRRAGAGTAWKRSFDL